MKRGIGARGASIAICATAAHALATSGAVAQVTDPGIQTVGERFVRSDRAAPPIVGAFTVDARLFASAGYETNVLALPVDADGSPAFIVNPTLAATSIWSLHQVGFNSFARINRFTDTADQNTNDFGGTGFGRLDIGRNAAISVNGGFSRRTVGRGSPDAAFRDDPQQTDELFFGATATARRSRLIATASAAFRRIDFRNPIDDFNDRDEVSLSARLGVLVTPRLTTFAEGFYVDRQFDQGVDQIGVTRDSAVYGARGGLSMRLTDVLSAEGSIGFFEVEQENEALANQSGLDFLVEATWNPSDLTSLIVRARQENQASVQPGANNRIRSEVGVIVQQEVTRRWLATGNLRYFEDEFDLSGRLDENFEGSASLGYKLSPRLIAEASYRYFDRSSTEPLANFSNNTISVALRAAL